MRKESKHLLDIAKQAVEMAIEEDEETAIKWLNEVTIPETNIHEKSWYPKAPHWHMLFEVLHVIGSKHWYEELQVSFSFNLFRHLESSVFQYWVDIHAPFKVKIL